VQIGDHRSGHRQPQPFEVERAELLPFGGNDGAGSKIGISPRLSAAIRALSLVDAGDVMTKIVEAGPGDEADIAGADHGHAHRSLQVCSLTCLFIILFVR